MSSDEASWVRAFDALFSAHYSDVLAYVVRRSSLANAEDALAETFPVAWSRRDQVRDDALPWLPGVARRVLANQRHGERRPAAMISRLRAISSSDLARHHFSFAWRLS